MSSNIFSSSSRGGVRQNQDGSRNVHCYQCGEFIATSFLNISRALCEICRRVENGEPLNDDMIRNYRLAKASRVDVSVLTLPEEDPLRAHGIPRKRFSLASMAGELVRAIGKFKITTVPKIQENPDKTKASVAVAKSKRRGRLFENVDLIGSMEEVDKKLKPK